MTIATSIREMHCGPVALTRADLRTGQGAPPGPLIRALGLLSGPPLAETLRVEALR